MKFSAALLVSVLAVLTEAVKLINEQYTITEGVPFTIKWDEAVDPVTIKLKNGESGNLKDVQTITSSGTSGAFTWTPENLPSGTYAFEITDSTGDVNYSPQFSYQGTGTLSTTSSTASSTASTTESSSTSSETKSTTSSASLTSSTMTPITNSTMTTSTRASTSRSSTATVTSSSSTSTATEVPNTNNGQRVASSLALVFGAVAAFVAFN